MSAPIPLPSGYSAPEYVISSTDRGGWAVIASSISLTFILLFAAIRLWMRYPFRNAFSSDDIVLLTATVISSAQSSLVLVAAHLGIGRSEVLLNNDRITILEQLVYASDLAYIMALLLSKSSMVLLALRLSPERFHLIAAKSTLGFCLLLLIASGFIIGLGCNPKHPWSGQCGSLYERWVTVEVCGCILELAIFVIVARVFVEVQRKWHSKLKGLVVFGLRLPVIVFAAYRLSALSSLVNSQDRNLDRVDAVIWTQIELSWSLVMATIPCLMPFMMKLNTNLGAFSPDTILAQTQQDSQQYANGSYAMQSRKSSHVKSKDDSERHMKIRPDGAVNKSSIVSPRADERSLSSDDSTGLIIKRTVEVSYSQGP
ncbi:hypothetical protein LTR86_005104 [Recurvomyces mirabilis]|nr:hypothetical protein LTR86_005104 [Recurvomyces mirabilis]